MAFPATKPARASATWVVVVTAVVAGTFGYVTGRKGGASETVRAEPHGRAAVSSSRSAAKAAVEADFVGAPRGNDGDGWEARWQHLRAEPNTVRTERERGDMLRELARSDHTRALDLALGEPNLKLRAELRNAVLTGWAGTDADGAANFALTLRDADREAAMAAVFAGAADHPAEAAKLAGVACDRDPNHAFAYTQSLVAALSEQGNFDVAVNFLAGRPVSPQRTEATDNAFVQWAEHRPADAAAAAEAISDPELRAAAFRGLAVGWSHADPAGLADFAVTLAPGPSRAIAFANAVPRWVEVDPSNAITWLSQREPSADFDSGVAAVALSPVIVSERPELAMSLAQSITDAPLRTNTLHNLAVTWAKTDPNAARQYIESSRVFAPSERELLLAELSAGAGESGG